MKTIEVVAAIIRKDDKILSTQRGYGPWKDWWEFPGGKLEPGETPQQALVREIREELDAEISLDKFLYTVRWDYPQFHLTMHCFMCSLRKDALHLNEHEAARWLTKEDIYSVGWLPADDMLLPMITRELESARVIRPAQEADIPSVLRVMEAAKRIMRESGNLHQWEGGYPTAEVIGRDLSAGGGMVMEEGGKIVAYFAFLPSPEPTYSRIEGGEWLEDRRPYHVIHRIASLPDAHGVFRDLVAWCLARDPHLRIDTHRDNRIMQHCILGAGFRYCGIIHLADGQERLAYELVFSARFTGANAQRGALSAQ